MIIDQYKILHKVGEGGMGIIYKAEHCTLRQVVAIKALPGSLSCKTEIRERFLREATIQAKISHPNIVNVLNFFESEGNCYIVIEYVEGETLEAMIKRLGLIPPERCVSLFRQILAGIQYAHEKGVVHRDIKPGNIMVTSDGTVKIMDFGIAKMAGGANLTRAGVKVGTVWYMSPEQVKGMPATVASDIYSLGVTLFQMVTGRVPFYAKSEFDVMKTIVETPPPSPKNFYPYIPVQLEQAILKSLAKNPAQRFKSAQDFSLAVAWQDGVRSRAGSDSVLARLSALRHGALDVVRRQGGVLAVAGCLLVGIIALFSWFNQRTAPAKTSFSVQTMGGITPAGLAEASPPEHENAHAGGAVAAGGINKVEKQETLIASPKRETVAFYLKKGMQYQKDGEFAKAREMYHEILKLDKGNKAAQTGIAYSNMSEKSIQDR